MTLTTHAVVGAAVASLVPAYPLVGFAAAFASHFAIDSIPHWAEGRVLLRSVTRKEGDPLSRDMVLGKNFMYDLAIICADGLLGIFAAVAILYFLFSVPIYIVLLGAFAGQLPDALQFLYMKTRLSFMTRLQLFHSGIQTEHENIAYLGIEIGIILLIIIGGFLGVFML